MTFKEGGVTIFNILTISSVCIAIGGIILENFISFFRIAILLDLGVPNNQILLYFSVPDNQILLCFGVPNNQTLLHYGVPDNCSMNIYS